jgi:hypothetical protein
VHHGGALEVWLSVQPEPHEVGERPMVVDDKD